MRQLEIEHVTGSENTSPSPPISRRVNTIVAIERLAHAERLRPPRGSVPRSRMKYGRRRTSGVSAAPRPPRLASVRP